MLSQDPAWSIARVRGLVNESGEQREADVEHINDVCGFGELRGDECSTLAAVCAWGTLVERGIRQLSHRQDFPVRETFLDTLGTLAIHELAPRWAVELVVSRIAQDDLDVSEVDAYDALVEHLGESNTGGSAPESSDPARLLGIVRDIVAQIPLQQRNGLNELTRAVAKNEILDHEVSVLASIVGWSVVIDDPAPAREELLGSLRTLADSDLVPDETLELLTQRLSPDVLNSQEREYYESLMRTSRQRDARLAELREERRGNLAESPTWLLELLHGVSSASSETRQIHATIPRIIAESDPLDRRDASVLAGTVAWAALAETHGFSLRTELLRSLRVMAERNLAPIDAVEPVILGLARQDLTSSEIESYEALVAVFSKHYGRFMANAREHKPWLRAEACNIVELIRGLTDPSGEQRAAVARDQTSLVRNYGHGVPGLVAELMARTVLIETQPSARQNMLGALNMLAAGGHTPPATLEQVETGLTRDKLGSVEIEHLNDLLSILDKHRGSTSGPDQQIL